ncbi:MAG TPA: TetR/AcrR family transcriptional regulator [Anaerolineaceae bacterium]|nr:TetR/AcrR family transcriptional regulator [Anaerolineaceae bacterium]HPN53517.1 TetR/AcrR family transcriptional regulator [Anaerolineaceae bacterium]
MDKRTKILNSARSLFSENGYKDTSVSDITKKAGVAAGTFYLYFPSKDQIFMEIFLEENVKLKKELLAAVNLDQDPLSVIRQVTLLNMQGMMTNPILKQWYNRDVFLKIEESYRAENGLERVDFVYDFFLEIVEKWQAEGKMRQDISSRMIMAMFVSIITMDAHKDEIGLEFFPEILDHMTAFLVNGLTGKKP